MATIVSEAAEITAQLENQNAGERIAWLYETFGERVVASTSFGLQAAVMLNLIAKHAPKIPVIFVDTGYLFPETYAYIEELKSQLDVDIRHYVPKLTAAHQEAIHGKLWEQGAEGNQKYATINKVEPMNRAIQEIGGDVWLSGLRRSQSSSRANRQLAEQQSSTLKVYPILDWPDAQIASYFCDHKLTRHPLEKEGYLTMGDRHSTRLPEQGEGAESTRYNGAKYECGLHEASGQNDFQI